MKAFDGIQHAGTRHIQRGTVIRSDEIAVDPAQFRQFNQANFAADTRAGRNVAVKITAPLATKTTGKDRQGTLKI